MSDEQKILDMIEELEAIGERQGGAADLYIRSALIALECAREEVAE